jgi:hypothetical protein
MSEPAIEPDTKDWTWVLDRPCPECGFVAADIATDAIAAAVRGNAVGWRAHLLAPTARHRPRPDVWSTLEYGAHVRDVHRVFAQRVRLMLTEDVPTFPNWDQDATALADRYDRQDPAVVMDELVEAATQVADLYDSVPADAWSRRGLRSNGSAFSVETIGRYHLHDVVHHLVDVERA